MAGIFDTQEDDYMIVESRRSKIEGTKNKEQKQKIYTHENDLVCNRQSALVWGEDPETGCREFG
jgi:hypothetical protein